MIIYSFSLFALFILSSQTIQDDLVKQASEGLIPNGKLRTPVADILGPQNNNEDSIFSKTIDDLLPVEEDTTKPIADTTTLTPLASNGGSLATEDALSEIGTIQNLHVDDSSVPSSLGTNREDFPIQSKYQLAEDNSVYSGPDVFRRKNVLAHLELYFTTFVFSDSGPSFSTSAVDYPGVDEDEDDWQSVADLCPKIQLWPEDRRSTETSALTGRSSLTPAERFVRVWEENVVPCGKPALRRLFPNRQARLSFHGDQLFQNGVPYPYAECRQVFICLSSAALYLLLKEDSVTSRSKKKKFPNPIKEDAIFGDSPWPHAVARHSYQDLQTIAIGFDFQRLTLHFSNPRKSEPFVYVMLISNKKETIRILQEIQRLAKESNESVTDLVSDATAVAITNDSQEVFDALSIAVAPDMVGTVIHYQIVQQRWKHGERGTVRRTIVVTESKIFLLNEDYISDGHTASPDCSDVSKVGEVSFQTVDEASLEQISEVQAAGVDPRGITLIINPLSRLSRTHRWRLLCRDGAGAERLVEDLRKAIAQAGY